MLKMKPEVIKAGAENSTDENYALIRCPGCKGVGNIDRDQFEGRVSIQCDCGYHETHDLKQAEVDKWMKQELKKQGFHSRPARPGEMIGPFKVLWCWWHPERMKATR